MSTPTIESENEEKDSSVFEVLSKLGEVIDTVVHGILDIEECGTEFVSLAIEDHSQNVERLKNDFEKYNAILESSSDRDERIVAVRHMRRFMREVGRLKNSSKVETLEQSLFINLFAVFDKYIGDLICVLYEEKPSLYNNIQKSLSLSEALSFSSLDELKHNVLLEDVAQLKRKSHVQQFEDLEKKFSINLRKYRDWPAFVEASQRRNLFVHCDGVVSPQYLEVCRNANVKFEDQPEIGDKLTIGAGYFYHATHVVIVTAIMLGHTLWRKLDENELENADRHLNGLIFEFLHMESWVKSISL